MLQLASALVRAFRLVGRLVGLTTLLLLMEHHPASAHRPLFTQTAHLVLPNGEPGELRLLRGDGILGPDPVRALILDAKGSLVARSHRSHLIAVSCAVSCKIFDLADNAILELEPSSFRPGPVIPGLEDHDRDKLWALEAGDDTWGFRIRQASAIERVEGNWAMLAAGSFGFALMVVPGVIAGLIGLVTVKRSASHEMTLMRGLAVCAAIFAIGCLVVVGFLFAILGPFTTELWLAATGLGVMVGLAIGQLAALHARLGHSP